MAGKVSYKPEDQHTINPHIVVKDAARLIDFYTRAFGAEERSRFVMPDGSVGHAELRIGDSSLMLSDEFPGMGTRAPVSVGGTSTVLHLYVEDADLVFQRALAEGATEKRPLGNEFWGERYGQITDPAGHVWAIATRIEKLTPEEVDRRGREWMAKAGA
jgi:PhnB protein